MAHLRDMRQEHISQKPKENTSLGKHGFRCENNTLEYSCFWDVKTMCILLELLDPKDGGRILLQNNCNYCQLTHCNILEDLNLQQHHCKNIIPNNILLFFWFI